MDLEDIQKKLEQGGEPFEAEIARLLKRNDCRVSTHDHYLDADKEKSREMDVHAVWQVKTSDDFEFNIHYCVECKSTNRDWVFYHDGHERPTTIENKVMWKGITLQVPESLREQMDSSADRSIYEGYVGMRPMDRRHTYPHPADLCGSCKVIPKEKDVYKAANQAIKASQFILQEEIKKPVSGKRGLVSLVVPVIATDNSVFVADISRGKAEHLRQVENEEVVWYIFKYLDKHNKRTEYTIPVVTPTSVDDLIGRISFNCIFFCKEYFGKELRGTALH